MPASAAFTFRFHSGVFKQAGVSALAAALSWPGAASAAEPPESGKPSTSWGIGIGAASSQKPYLGVERENRVIPMIQFENRYVRLLGPMVEVKLPSLAISETQRLKFGLVGRYDLSGGYEPSDSRVFEGMSERKGSFWAGARAEWENPVADVTAEWTADASGNSKGQMFSLGLGRTWRFGKQMMLTPRVAATWQDGKYVDYYYGVPADEARLGRPEYRGESGVSAEVGLRGVYMFDRHQSLFLNVAVTGLAAEIKDSPLVDRSTRNAAFLGYLYRF